VSSRPIRSPFTTSSRRSPPACARRAASSSALPTLALAANLGQTAWWEATPKDAPKPPVGWSVTFTVDWGDCPSGCIDKHTWTYDLGVDGTVTFVSETGPALPPEVMDALRAANHTTGVGDRVTAGPTCPVQQPNDPACHNRPVGGAVLVVTGAGGVEVARVTTDASGLFRIGLQAGRYTLGRSRSRP
jgi:hypothetical protein